MIRGRNFSYAVAAAVVAVASIGATSARADALFTVSGASSGDGPLNGTADFSLINGNTQLQIVLTNTGTDTRQGQAFSGLEFSVSGLTLGALTSATATDGLIQSPYYSSGAADPFDVGANIISGQNYLGNSFLEGRWHSSAGPTLIAIGGGQPSEMIMGTVTNSSFPNGGTSNFDPYVYQEGTFVYDISGVGTDPTISDVTFEFGTGPDYFPVSTPTGPIPITGGGVPEPASLGLLGLGAVGMLLRRRRR